MDEAPIIDVEAKVIRLEFDGGQEREIAAEKVEQVMEQIRHWARAWRAVVMQTDRLELGYYPPDTVGCGPGSCWLRVGERHLAIFRVVWNEERCDVDIHAEYPREAEPTSVSGLIV